MYHRAFSKIDLAAIEHNFNALSQLLGRDVKKCAVVKADAYGHGAIEVARFLENKADYLAVACFDEAMQLRSNSINAPILILGYTDKSQYEMLINNNITATVYSLEDILVLNKTAARLEKTARVHIAVDTGMGRLGFNLSEASLEVVKTAFEAENLFVEGIFSHFAKADHKDKDCAREQKERFDRFLSELEKRGVTIPIKHISNSAGIIDLDSQYSMVRMGIALYGCYPSDEVKKERAALIPAMEVISRVIHVKTVPAGTPIGYGHAYVTDSEKKIATVSIGYADGFSRALSNKGYVLINGERARVVGKVCMDQIMVDVTDIDSVYVGDEAVIIGKSGNREITAEEIGELSGSFNYEVLTTFMPRVTRIYK